MYILTDSIGNAQYGFMLEAFVDNTSSDGTFSVKADLIDHRSPFLGLERRFNTYNLPRINTFSANHKLSAKEMDVLIDKFMASDPSDEGLTDAQKEWLCSPRFRQMSEWLEHELESLVGGVD